MKRIILSAILILLTAIGTLPRAAAFEAVSAETAVVTEAPTDLPTEAPAETLAVTPRAAKNTAPTAAADAPQITFLKPSANGILLRWTKYPQTKKYYIFIRKPDDSGWKIIGTSAVTSFEHCDPVNNTTYTYTVRAADRNGDFISAAAQRCSFRYLASPVMTAAENTADGQKLTWEPVYDAAFYKVYYQNGDSWRVAGVTEDNYFVNTKAVSGRTYTYTVRCLDDTKAFPLSYYDPAGFSAGFIAAPRITSFNAEKDGVSVSWKKVAGAQTYAVYRKCDTGWKRLGVTDQNTFSDTGAPCGADSTYTVRCIDGDSIFISGYDPDGFTVSYLKPPVILDVSFRDNSYTLTWNGSDDAASYRVFRKEQGAAKWKYLGSADGNTFTDTKAKKNGIYTYTVRSMGDDGNYLSYYRESGCWYCMGQFIIGSLGGKDPETHPLYTCAVTENELRRIVADTANGWLGAVEGDAAHQDILAFYNQYTPLAVGYAMQPHDAWCAAFVSAVWIRCGVAAYTGTECGCGRFIDVAKRNHTWVESDAYAPKVGDAIIYYWSDTGKGECTKGADHVGLVTAVNGETFTVTEGNTGAGTGCVATREVTVDNRFIRGFITPDYQQIAKFLSMKARYL